MIFYLTIIYIIFLFLNKSLRENMFIMTIIYTIFFYSSHDPIVGMPLYFEVMMISLLLSFFKKDKKISILKNPLGVFLVLVLILVIQVINIDIGSNVMPVILLKESNTDVLDIAAQLATPILNLTVIKHLVFFIFYLLFILFNHDLIRDDKTINKLFMRIIRGFEILFICLIIESIIVNVLGGYNDRWLMKFLFSFKTLNMQDNWRTFGISSVAFCFTERSYMGVVIVYYLIQSVYKKYNIDFLKWFIISIIAVVCTGSSSALMIVVLFSIYYFVELFIKGKSVNTKILFAIALILGIVLFAKNSSILLGKVNIFFNQSESWSSGYFRSQSISYGLEAINYSPLIGIGIGTVYTHSMLVQTMANIGVFGFLATIMLHLFSIKFYRINFEKTCRIIITLLICTSTFTVQDFTSPLLLILILGCVKGKEVLLTEYDYKISEA